MAQKTNKGLPVAGSLIIALAFVVIAAGVSGLVAYALKGTPISAATTETTTTSTATPTPTPPPTPDEETVSSYTDEQLLKLFGQPREFKRTSTKLDLEPRVEATGIFDAVTYNVKPEGLDGICEEILSNPIYLTGVDQALREVDVIGESDWAKKFFDSYNPITTEWWEQWIEKDTASGKWYVTKDYHLIAARYCCIVKGMQYWRDIDKADIKCHWPLNVEMEYCFKSDEGEDYPFWVYRLVFKDGRIIYIGINQLDYRWAIIPPVPTPTPTSTPTPTPPPDTPTPTPPTSTSTPTPTPQPKNRQDDPINRNTDPSAAADIGSPSDPENHNNQVEETPEPTSPGSYTNQVTPTPVPTAPTSTPKPTEAPKPTPTTAPKPTEAPKPTPSVEPGVSGDGVNTGKAPTTDPDG